MTTKEKIIIGLSIILAFLIITNAFFTYKTVKQAERNERNVNQIVQVLNSVLRAQNAEN